MADQHDDPADEDEPNATPSPDGPDSQDSRVAGGEDLLVEVEQELAESIRERLPSGPIEPAKLAELLATLLTVEVRKLVHFQGPLPPPEMLREYNEISPGLALRLVDRADKEQDHRHEMNREQVNGSKSALFHKAFQGYVGQALAFIIAMTCICGGIWLIAQDKSTQGLTAIIGALVALVGVFVTGKVIEARKQSKGTGAEEPSRQNATSPTE